MLVLCVLVLLAYIYFLCILTVNCFSDFFWIFLGLFRIGEEIYYTPQGRGGRPSYSPRGGAAGGSVYVTPGDESAPRHLDGGVARQLEGVALGGDGGAYMREVSGVCAGCWFLFSAIVLYVSKLVLVFQA